MKITFEEILGEAESLTGQKAKIIKPMVAFEINDIVIVYEDTGVYCDVELLIEIIQLISDALINKKRLISIPYFFKITSEDIANIFGVDDSKSKTIFSEAGFDQMLPSNFNIQGLHRLVYFLNNAPEAHSKNKVLDINLVIESLLNKIVQLRGQVERVIPKYALEYEELKLNGDALKKLFVESNIRVKASKPV